MNTCFCYLFCLSIVYLGLFIFLFLLNNQFNNSITMHRAYQPITPANNKLLKQRWDQSRFDRHRQKVQNAQAVIDNRPPHIYMHLHLKLKKLQMEEERTAIIERDNRILLEKMCYIMRTRGRVDNYNDYEQKSLNKTKRQRELLRVTHENQAILKRIFSKEAHYSHLKWEHEWELNKKYMANIAKYPQSYTVYMPWKTNDSSVDRMNNKSIISANQMQNQSVVRSRSIIESM
ncbi:sperm axonemal maintenance protein CFAP97D1-like [Antedon mediterranea]|uniref:sperm axonemal maintenance protein CFAP97D1-like n=1 Tax=Antedon mediterranea TaxID=105859 RepID=UPI003AF858A6